MVAPYDGMRRIALFVLSPIAVAVAVIARRMLRRRRVLRAAPPAEEAVPLGEDGQGGAWVVVGVTEPVGWERPSSSS